MGFYGSQYDYVTHIALIATLCVALITSFQLPMEKHSTELASFPGLPCFYLPFAFTKYTGAEDPF